MFIMTDTVLNHENIPPLAPKETGRQRTQLLSEKLQEFMREKHHIEDFDPVLALADIAHSPTTPLKVRVECLREVAGYVHAKRKAVDITAGEGTKINFMFVRPDSGSTESPV